MFRWNVVSLFTYTMMLPLDALISQQAISINVTLRSNKLGKGGWEFIEIPAGGDTDAAVEQFCSIHICSSSERIELYSRLRSLVQRANEQYFESWWRKQNTYTKLRTITGKDLQDADDLAQLVSLTNAWRHLSVDKRVEWLRSEPSVQDIAAVFHTHVYDQHHYNTFFGIPTWQNPNDAWITQEVISEIRPEVIVECGTRFGGSAVMWWSLLRYIVPNGRVISIDVEPQLSAAALAYAERSEGRLIFLKGDSADPHSFANIQERVGNSRALVLLDSLHSKEHVLAELKLYSALVPVGSYIIVQDSNLNGHPVKRRYQGFAEDHPGPWEAIHEFLSHNNNFEIDKARERLQYTHNVDGYLRRVT
eukprot:TRINITY_DN75454_c0_g1_i1.p1 TRINITY_DN75454_c0_g1~~TRINITY_DN75454_c0_g1_i1.p1  ORF type:complete len:363 (+),score=28.25 TRINITY_DN75454_c0_g1_i1:89-1177(+)